MIYLIILVMALALVVLVFLVYFGFMFFYSDNWLYTKKADRWVESACDAGRFTGGFAMVLAAVIAFFFILSIFLPFG